MASMAISPFPTTIRTAASLFGTFEPIRSEVRRISGPKLDRKMTDITNVEDMVQFGGAQPPNLDFSRHFHPGLIDFGSLSFELNYTTAAYAELRLLMIAENAEGGELEDLSIPRQTAESWFTITFSDGHGFMFAGFVESIDSVVDNAAGVTVSVSVKVNGNFSLI